MLAALPTTEALLGAAALTAALAALHLAVPAIRRHSPVPERATASFAGGAAVAYVFLHLLPEIAEGNEAVGEALQDVVEPSPLLDLGVFLVALTGFTILYGLERLARRHRAVGDGDPPAAVYRLHLGSFLVYNALITYTLPLRVETGAAFALLFAAAMGLHFLVTDRGLSQHYPRRFRSRGRWLLAAALVAGWVAAALLAPTSTLVVSVLTALLGGAVLLNVFKEELPAERESSFPWFLAGLALYAGLLTGATAVSET